MTVYVGPEASPKAKVTNIVIEKILPMSFAGISLDNREGLIGFIKLTQYLRAPAVKRLVIKIMKLLTK